MSKEFQDYVPADHIGPYWAMTLHGAWSHEKPWRVIEQHGDLDAAFRDLCPGTKDGYFWDFAINYSQVNL